MNVIGIVGWKNSGKTTLASAVIRELSGRGLAVSSIKHAHHLVDVDQPGTDSYKHREAGAQEVILAGGQRFAIMHELRGAKEPTLDELLARLGPCEDRKSTRLNSSHVRISYAVFCLKKKTK